ncbi:ABC transporter substrate-binding protein [Roseiarcaceae bacterium H3SJ34-1]|uniref:ABC transporter substrate-binding protein n=1 Tax=Terripilifer ovatus TaxID=3032367 RepID=UPI003AB94469|nr:ABC transporter substrate-binding protein [Roseiarcaceae bacterium H3SJ34-1]
MKPRFRSGLFGIVLGVSAAVTLQPAKAQAQVKDTLVVAQQTDAYTLDPAKHTLITTANILFHIYDVLVTQDAEGAPKPALAVSWSNPDPLTWRFKLREGVKFSNGEEFNADAVKFTYDRALDPSFKAPNFSRIAAIKSVEVVDKYTVDFKTATPFPTMLFSVNEGAFASMIVPPDYLREKGPDALVTAPVGTGPYRLVEWRKDNRIVLEANPAYWGGAPKIARLIFRPIRETRTRIAELTSGGVDIAVDIPPEDVPPLKSGNTKVAAIASDTLYFYAFDTLKPSPLQNKLVRQALNYAVDVDAIQQALLSGMGQRIALTLPTTAFGYDKSWQPYPYDPKKARALLAEAGYPNGFTIPLISRQGRYLKDREIMEATIGFLAKVGVKVEAQYLSPGVWAEISEKKARDGISFPGWGGRDPDIVWHPLLHTGQYQSYYSNPELDKLLDAGRSTLDLNERKAIYAKAAAIIKEEAPQLPLLQPPLIYGMNARLHWQPRGDGVIDLRQAYFE